LKIYSHHITECTSLRKDDIRYVKKNVFYMYGSVKDLEMKIDEYKTSHYAFCGFILYCYDRQVHTKTRFDWHDEDVSVLFVNDILVNDSDEICIAVDSEINICSTVKPYRFYISGKKILYFDNFEIIYMSLSNNLVCYDRIDKTASSTTVENEIVYVNKKIMYIKHFDRLCAYKRY